MRTCPIVSGFEYQTESAQSKPFAAWNNDTGQRMVSSSGGVFSALATQVLNNKGIVVGATLENSYVHHIIVDRMEDLHLLQGSKYQQSDLTGIYKATKEHLKKGTFVLFSGTPCQVAGLLSYLGKRRYDNLVTVDLICGGVPSRLNVDKYMELSPQSEIVSYRNKRNGWIGSYLLTANIQGREVVSPPYGEIVTKGYAGGLTNRYSCYDCKFVGINKKADLTIGDDWGDTHFDEEHYCGLSFIVIHSQKGADLVKLSNMETHSIDWREPLLHNPRLVNGYVIGGKCRPERKMIAFNFKHLPYSILKAIYCGEMNGMLSLPYKAIRYMLWRTNIAYQKRMVNKALKSL